MEVCGVGTEDKPDQEAESVKETPAAKESAGEVPAADANLQATLASPTMPGTPKGAAASAAPPDKEPAQTTAKEVPAATPPAARVPGAGGAAKSTTTPTAAV